MKYGCRRKQKKKQFKKEYIKQIISPSSTSTNSRPHCVTELSTRLYKRMKNNIVMLSGLNNNNKEKLIKYANVEYGSNVKFREINGIKIIDVPNIKHSCVMIATHEKEGNFILQR